MPYTFTLDDAIQLATNAHYGQTDKVREPYILHPLRVMFTFQPYMVDERMTAVMHDVVEDTKITFKDLKERGCPEKVIQALELLTHTPNQPYAEYVEMVRPNPLARAVKIADIQDNLSMERLLRLDTKTIDRLRNKYGQALEILDA